MEPLDSVPKKELRPIWSLLYMLAKEMDKVKMALGPALDVFLAHAQRLPCEECSPEFLRMLSGDHKFQSPYAPWVVQARARVAARVGGKVYTEGECELEIQTTDKPWSALLLIAAVYPIDTQIQYYPQVVGQMKIVLESAAMLWPTLDRPKRLSLYQGVGAALADRTTLVTYLVQKLNELEPEVAQRLGWVDLDAYENYLTARLDAYNAPPAPAVEEKKEEPAPVHEEKKEKKQVTFAPVVTEKKPQPAKQKKVPASMPQWLAERHAQIKEAKQNQPAAGATPTKQKIVKEAAPGAKRRTAAKANGAIALMQSQMPAACAEADPESLENKCKLVRKMTGCCTLNPQPKRRCGKDLPCELLRLSVGAYCTLALYALLTAVQYPSLVSWALSLLLLMGAFTACFQFVRRARL